MKTILQIAALIILSNVAWGQSTTTFHNSDGSTTKITASCDSTGDCHVWDSTNELGIRARVKLLKEQKAFCSTHNLPTNMVKAYDTDTMLGGKNINQDCWQGWVIENNKVK